MIVRSSIVLLLGTLLFPTTSNAQPYLESTSPLRNSVTNDNTQNITLQFNSGSSIDETSITSSSLRVFGSMSGMFTYSASVSGTEITIDPDDPMMRGERINVIITSGVQNLSAESIKPASFDFYVGSAPSSGRLAWKRDHYESYYADKNVTGDFNNDNLPDVASIYKTLPEEPSGYGAIRVLRNDGYPSFTQIDTLVDFSQVITEFETGDLNNDGILDLLIAYGSGNRIFSYLNDGTGAFTLGSTTQPPVSASSTNYLELADFNLDGHLDYVTGERYGMRVYFGDGTGAFTLDSTLTTDNYPVPNVLDLDLDGDIDIVDVYQQVLRFWLNDGTGNFSAQPTTMEPIDPVSTFLADQNGDELPDIFSLSINSSQHPIGRYYNSHLQTSGLSFTQSQNDYVYTWARDPKRQVTGDYDGDGDLDIVIQLWDGDGYADILQNDGAGTFSYLGETFSYRTAKRFDTADFDGDGALDLVSTWLGPDYAIQGIGFLLNDEPSTLTFTTTGATFTENGSAQPIFTGASLIDPDIDLYDEIKVAITFGTNCQTGDVLFLENQGTGTGQIGISDSTISFEGSEIGAFTGGTYADGSFTIELNEIAATADAVEAVLNAIRFEHTTDDPIDGNHNLVVAITDMVYDVFNTTVPVDVIAVNDKPVAVDDSFSGYEDTQVAISSYNDHLLRDDSDIETPLSSLTAHLVAQPAAGGTVSLNTDGTFTYDPPLDVSGPITFEYTVFDGTDMSDPGTVTINLTGVADVPTVSPSNASGLQDQWIALNITAASTDTDGGETLQVRIADFPSGSQFTPGTTYTSYHYVDEADLGSLQFKGPTGVNGTFTLSAVAIASEGYGSQQSSSESFTVTIQDVLDPPVFTAALKDPSAGNPNPYEYTKTLDVELEIDVTGDTADRIQIARDSMFTDLYYDLNPPTFQTDTYDVTLPAGDDGLRSVYIKASNAAGATTTTAQILYDGTLPQVNPSNFIPTQSNSSNLPIRFQIIFSEQVWGLVPDAVAFTGTTAPGNPFATIQLSKNTKVLQTSSTYFINVYGLTDAGEVVISLKDGYITDSAGNPLDVSGLTSSATYQQTAVPDWTVFD